MITIKQTEWWKSKTLIVNLVSLVGLAIGLVLEAAGVLNLSAQVVTILSIILTVLNAGLRLLTNSAITGTPASKHPPTGPKEQIK